MQRWVIRTISVLLLLGAVAMLVGLKLYFNNLKNIADVLKNQVTTDQARAIALTQQISQANNTLAVLRGRVGNLVISNAINIKSVSELQTTLSGDLDYFVDLRRRYQVFCRDTTKNAARAEKCRFLDGYAHLLTRRLDATTARITAAKPEDYADLAKIYVDLGKINDCLLYQFGPASPDDPKERANLKDSDVSQESCQKILPSNNVEDIASPLLDPVASQDSAPTDAQPAQSPPPSGDWGYQDYVSFKGDALEGQAYALWHAGKLNEASRIIARARDATPGSTLAELTAIKIACVNGAGPKIAAKTLTGRREDLVAVLQSKQASADDRRHAAIALNYIDGDFELYQVCKLPMTRRLLQSDQPAFEPATSR